MSKWRDVHTLEFSKSSKEVYGENVEAHLRDRIRCAGPPPAHLHRLGSRVVERLPPGKRRGSLYTVLTRRRTSRLFDRETSISRQDFATLVFYTYGCQGIYRFSDELSVIKKTSASGGSLHPIEVYPLVLRVAGIESGLYHYDASRHVLELIDKTTLEEGEALAHEFLAGQPFARDAHALFILTARYRRCFWKYPHHQKAYRVMMMDVGHLSQTFYLVCTELGIGAFFSAAIAEVNIEKRLRLDDLAEGAVAISGCGIVTRDRRLKPFEHAPYRVSRD
jgi:putative peptide maturation dehydrogenase